MLLNVEDLSVVFHDVQTPLPAVKNVSFRLEDGEILGIVGESGSGKSTVAHAIMGLLDPGSSQVTGRAIFGGTDLLALSPEALRRYQGKEISIIFQDPMTSLNPTMTVGAQVEETLRIHTGMSRAERKRRALEAMTLAELDEPERLYRCYPHQLSGGMRQRVMIASALASRPRLLIADEPTTALDVTIQAELLRTLGEINRREGVSILFISHDLGVIRRLCRRVIVMQGGQIVEQGDAEAVFTHPQEDYTRQLIASRPTRRKRRGGNADGG